MSHALHILGAIGFAGAAVAWYALGADFLRFRPRRFLVGLALVGLAVGAAGAAVYLVTL